MIHMTRRGVAIRGLDEHFGAAQHAFAAQHCFRLERFVDADLLTVVRRALAVAPFHDRTHDGIGTELCLSGGAVVRGAGVPVERARAVGGD